MNEAERKAGLLQKARLLPEKPGIYRMRSSSGALLYVGKSKNLKNRVSSYFQTGEKQAKTQKLVSQIFDFTTIVTQTEEEALLLENELIKLHKPKYNIRLQDDKNYPYLYLDTESAYPLPQLRRRRDEKERGLYFGPYSSAAAVYEIIRAANTLFSLPRCKKHFPEDFSRTRPCLYYDMGRCMGLCRGNVTPQEYKETIESLILFLKHDHRKLLSELEEKMLSLSAEMRFEAAASVRDSIAALKKLSEKQHVLATPDYSADVYALHQDDVLPIVSRLNVRRGRLIDAAHYAFLPSQIVTAESFSSLLWEHYRHASDLPRKILLDPALFDEEDTLLAELLHRRAGHAVQVNSPKRGTGLSLLRLARENAAKEAEHRKKKNAQDSATLKRLAELLSLKNVPRRIEAYDISNHGNDSIYGGMVVSVGTKLRRSLYRSFAVEQEEKDDYAAMVEVVLRRLSHKEEEGWETPDLILLDGGMTHVSVVRRALSGAGYDGISIFGMVKDEHHKTRTLVSDTDEISIAKHNDVFGFIYSLQEEVHRFSLSRMDASRRKKMLSSTLTNIAGIGEKKQKALLAHFKSIQNIRSATPAELRKVRGISAKDAENITAFFSTKDK